MAKISKSYILTPPQPQGHVMSVKCEQPLDELTHDMLQTKFGYCIITQTNRQMDDPITRCSQQTFQVGGIKMKQWMT